MSKTSPRRKSKQTEKDQLVLTPGGWRLKSKVHYVKPGHHIDSEGGRLKIIHTATGKVIKDLGEIPEPKLKRPKKENSVNKQERDPYG
jgi:hypothetical protein